MRDSIVTPGLTAAEYAERRTRFGASLPLNSVAIIPAYRTRFSSQNIFYPFQQNNNLLYLTGIDEPDAILVMQKSAAGEVKSMAFVAENDEHALLWSGPVCGVSNAKSHFGLDLAYSRQDFGEFIRGLSGERLLADLDENDCLAEEHRQRLKALNAASVKEMVQRLRLIKSASEQAVMREASRIGAEAFSSVIRWSKGRREEASLAARMEFEVRMRGASGLSYVPVVAGGDRANIIHYVRNDRIITEGSLVLMDAGAKYGGYCNDITRTWPVAGRFAEAQRELYEAVLRVQQQSLDMLRRRTELPGFSLHTLHCASVYFAAEELGKLGFRHPTKAVHKLYPHSIGHFLGMDLHDCPSIGYDEELQPGMVITVEPGLYVPVGKDYPERFHGIGVRIEDDVLVTTDGFVNLTAAVPKEVEELEGLMSQ